MFIVRPDLADEEMDRLISTIESNATAAGIDVKHVERMGKRRLAYKVRKFQEGVYVLFTLEGQGKGIAELERRLRVTEPVIKYLTVRIDEEQKRMAKIKKIRDSHARHKPEGAAEPGAEPAAATV